MWWSELGFVCAILAVVLLLMLIPGWLNRPVRSV